MADVTYRIIIESKGDLSSTESEKSAVASTPSGESASGAVSGGSKLSNKLAPKALGVAALAFAEKAIITPYINNVGLRTGNNTLQQRLSDTYSDIKRVIAFGTAMVGGFVTGNPLAIVAGVGMIVNRGIEISIAEEQIRLQQSVEQISITQSNIRAGAGGNRTGRNTY